MKLTKSNYYTTKNRYISNSKINDWLKSKRYFYEKHVVGTREKEETAALIIGKAVDTWLTVSRREFEKQYIRVARRSKDDSKVIQLTEAQYDEVVGICEAVEKHSCYQEFKAAKKQVILQLDKKIGMFPGLCGIPDAISQDNKIIFDLKTSNTIDPKKYYYHAQAYGYYRQQAMYQMLLEKATGVSGITSYHLVVEKDTDKIYKVQTFILDQNIINQEKENLKKILEDIAKEEKFEDPDISFANAILLTNPSPAKPELDGWENA